MGQGWISLHRRIKDNFLYPSNEKRQFSKFEAWVDILLMVNHEDRKSMYGNELITIYRGQKLTSIKGLAERWGWSRKKVSTFLDLLESENQIKQQRTTRATFITVVNYEDYQDVNIGNRGKGTSKEHQKNNGFAGFGKSGEHQKHEKGTSKEQQQSHVTEGVEGEISSVGSSKRTSEIKKKNIERTSKEHQKNTNNNYNNSNNDNKSNKEIRSKYKFETHHYQLANLLFKFMEKNNPKVKKPNLESWANTFRLMMERDDREGKEIQQMIVWCQNHHFWYKNILSANKLRQQYDRLYLEMKDDKRLQVVSGGAGNEANQSSYETDYSEYDFSGKGNMRWLSEKD